MNGVSIQRFRRALGRSWKAALALLLTVSLACSPLPDSLGPSQGCAYAAQGSDPATDSSSTGTDGEGSGKPGGTGTDKPSPEAPDPDEPDPKPDPKPEPEPEVPAITDLALRLDGVTGSEAGIQYADGLDYRSLLAFASNPTDKVRVTVTAKSQTLQLFCLATWSDGSSQPGASYVEWSSSNPDVAKVSTGGLVTPVSDGKARIDCTAKANYTGGRALTASLWLEVKGQKDSRYVSAIRIVDADGNPVGEAPIILDESVSNPAAFLRFGALVDVTDPKTGDVRTYDTRQIPLSTQVPDVADLKWTVNAEDMGFVDNNGLYRPKTYGTVLVYCDSPSGKGGDRVRAQVAIQTIDPEGNLKPDYHPQDSLTVKVYYETMPPQDITDPNDKNYAVNKTYSLADLQALGVQTATYTSLSSTSYYTINASGVPVAAVLRDAGVNLDGISTLEFGTYDGYSQPLSYSFLYQPRYYYPNIGNADNKYAGAEQVYPIFAFEASRTRNAETEKDYGDMTPATRFELVFGATPEGGTSQYQIKWVHTLYVMLAGAPPVEQGDDKPKDEGPKDDPQNPNAAGSDLQQSQKGGPGSGGNGDGGSGGAGDGAGNGPDAASSAGGSANGNRTAFSEDGSGAFSIYQIMNRNPSDVEVDTAFDNPYKRFVAPTALLVLIAGALQAAWWFRRQSRATPWAPPPEALAGA